MEACRRAPTVLSMMCVSSLSCVPGGVAIKLCLQYLVAIIVTPHLECEWVHVESRPDYLAL